MAPHNIQISPKTIGKLLKEEGLRVPPSQRSYRWKEEHVEELFKDIKAAMERDSAAEYFLGSIVSISSEGGVLIYDGQQRLATMMMLIAAVRNALLELSNERDAEIAERTYLFSDRRGSSGAEPHLVMNLEDKDFFFTEILPRPAVKPKRAVSTRMRDSHKRMYLAAKSAREFVTALIKLDNPAEADSRLNEWLNYIDSSLYVIWVQVLDERTAFTIFETMNDRGLKLSAADLLKNYLHATANDKQEREEVMHKWGSMTSVLETVEGEEENVVEYIRCFWVTRYGQTRTRYLYDRIKEKTTNKGKAMTLVRELEATVQDYAAIIMPSHERTTDRGEVVRASIEALRILGVTQVRPAALAAFQKLDHSQFSKFIVHCVSWSVRFLIGGTSSGTVEGYYSRIAMEIWNDKITTSDEATTAIKQILPNNEEFNVAFANARESRRKIARYYLRELQKTYDGISLSHELTLEHILPVDREEGWKNFTPEEYKECVSRLGNFALMEETANGAMNSAEYRDKKPILSSSKNCSLTTQAGSYNKWDKEEIDARQAFLAEIAVKTWPID